ncbi:MAG: PD-(D/E)XK nuclease domain-containing protein [Proteobacteria bacterium]|nr:PD-(D/E)XK nuclease domain-containing protein [Pseudomonadota bacterium]
MIELLENHHFQDFAEKVTTYFAGVPHEWHKDGLAGKESWYATALYFSFCTANAALCVEESTAHGRSDMVLITQKEVFLFEFKVAAQEKDKDKLLDQAMAQIRGKEYGKKYQNRGQPVHLLALVFGKEERSLLDYRHDLM